MSILPKLQRSEGGDHIYNFYHSPIMIDNVATLKTGVKWRWFLSQKKTPTASLAQELSRRWIKSCARYAVGILVREPATSLGILAGTSRVV